MRPLRLAINLNVDPRHADQNIRGVVALPAGTGKATRVAVFAKDAKADEAKAAGADLVGADELAEKVQGGEIEFDRVIATPDMMPLVGRLGKILGPRGLMPNPKLGTVTNDLTEAVQAAKGGQVQFRVEKEGILHAGVGKASFWSRSTATKYTRPLAGRAKRPSQVVSKGVMSSVWLSARRWGRASRWMLPI